MGGRPVDRQVPNNDRDPTRQVEFPFRIYRIRSRLSTSTMSSGFVSGGTADDPIERSDEWLAAQKELEANRLQRKAEEARQADGRSLYETLEANKGTAIHGLLLFVHSLSSWTDHAGVL